MCRALDEIGKVDLIHIYHQNWIIDKKSKLIFHEFVPVNLKLELAEIIWIYKFIYSFMYDFTNISIHKCIH